MKTLESLIIIILFLALSSISGGKRRKKHPPAGSEQQHNEQSLTGQIRQLFDEMLQNDASSQRSSTRQRRTRSTAQSAEQQCGYCTGEVEVAQAVKHKSTTEPLQVLVPQNDIPLVDVKAVQQEMGLSDLQNAIFWQEILAKPPALRGNRHR